MDNNRKIKIEVATNKSFGIVFATLFFIIGAYGYWKSWSYPIIYFLVSVILIFISFFLSNILSHPNKLWSKIGHLIGNFVSKIVLLVVFFMIIAPFSIFFKLIRKDLINQNIDHEKKTYWDTRDDEVKSMKKQY